MSDACKHRSGRKTPPSYSFPSLGSRERASRHALVLPGPGPTKGTEDGSCFTREGELHGARPHRAGAPTIAIGVRSEEHTSELQSLMRISYAVFCLKKKKTQQCRTIIRKINNRTNMK